MKEEYVQVKSLKGQCLPWYVDPCPTNQLRMEDAVMKIKGWNGKKGQKLIDRNVSIVA